VVVIEAVCVPVALISDDTFVDPACVPAHDVKIRNQHKDTIRLFLRDFQHGYFCIIGHSYFCLLSIAWLVIT
jgi:hypothetical protein